MATGIAAGTVQQVLTCSSHCGGGACAGCTVDLVYF